MRHVRPSTSERKWQNSPLRSTPAFSKYRWKRRVVTFRASRTSRSRGTFRPRRTTTTVCRKCRSTPRRASQVPTKVQVKDTKTKDPNRKRKGQPTSPTLSATVVARKATTRMNATPGSSVMTCKTPDTAKMDSALLRARLPPRVSRMPRSQTRPESSQCVQRKDEESYDATRIT